MTKRKRLIGVSLGLAIVGVGLGIAFVLGKQPATAPSGFITNKPLNNAAAARFQGRVTSVRMPTSEDGADYIEIDGHISILVGPGGYKLSPEAAVRGQVIGGLSSGTRVEVYAAKVGKDSYSLFGDKSYYVKALD